MTKSIFVILPNQLFEKKHLDRKYKYILWEHPHYFKGYNYNKKKLILHRASMRYYLDYLKDNNYDVKYINFYKEFKEKKYLIFDPIDKIKLPGKPTMLETPNFLLNDDLCKAYRKKTSSFIFYYFYMWSKKQLDIMPDIKSKDKDNRKSSMPKNLKIPKVPSNKTDEEYIGYAKRYVDEHFPDNYGNTDNFIFPVTHKTAKKWLDNFLTKRFEKFGPYQDFIDKNNNYLFHSLLSTSINIGLLNPDYVVRKATDKRRKIPINSREGFIRQLFWREYQRYCYQYFDFKNKNYFGNKKKLGKEWYDGDTGIVPIDDCIKEAFDTGYLHHIKRLMVVGNFMNLSGIKPSEGFRWFMEFSCDSYEWVMHQNVLDMVFFVSGGGTMRRPYISSSNYVLKMSNYKKEDWVDEWDKLYDDFIKKNKKKLYKYRYYFRSI